MLRWLTSFFGDNSNQQIIAFLEAENDELHERIMNLRDGLLQIRELWSDEIDSSTWIARDVLEADDDARGAN